MRISTFALTGALMSLALVPAPSTLADSAPGAAGETADPSETRVLVGHYQWNHQDKPGPLRAVFTATGENRWSVALHFRFDGRDRTYLGTAEGSLSGGRVEAQVQNENRRRSFTFEGEIEGGRLAGTHAETTVGRARRTGTLTLAEDRAGF